MMKRIENICRLTPAQEGMYVRYCLDPETNDYLQNYLFRIKEDADIELLKKALEYLPKRHSILKSAFASVSGTVKQVFLADRCPAIRDVNIAAPYSEKELSKVTEEEFTRSFDLQRDSLFRAVFLVFLDARFLLFQTHHLITDGWSMHLLLNDFIRDYQFFLSGGREESLNKQIAKEKRSRPSFSSCVALLRAKDPDPSIQYWKRTLKGGEPCLLTNNHHISRSDKNIRSYALNVSNELCREVEAFAARWSITVNTLFEVVFGLTLQKHSGQEDVVFNKVISGRSIALPGIDRVVGPLMNTIPIRIKCTDCTTPLLLLKQVGEQAVLSEENGYISLADAYRSAGIDPNSVNIIFAFGNYDTASIENVQSPIAALLEREQTEFPLTVNLSPAQEGFKLQFTFDDSYCSSRLIADLQESFLDILVKLLKLDAQQMNDVASTHMFYSLTPREARIILGQKERTQEEKEGESFTRGFSEGETALIPQKSVYQLFVEQVARTPNRIAIAFKDQRISFSSLMHVVDETADRLYNLKIRPSDVVAIHLNRSCWLFIYQLAILKIGAVFLPIDKRFPTERIQFICRDCCARLLISDSDDFMLSNGLKITPDELCSYPTGDEHAPEAYTEHCYIIYTSGSTGRPKGCLLKQTSLVNFCVNNNTLIVLKQQTKTVFACVNSVVFDYFIAESFLPLLNGYTVVLFDEEESIKQSLFLTLIEEHQVNVLMTTPTRLALFYADHTGQTALQNLACVCSSGEPLTKTLLTKIYEASPDVCVFNPLGPSECCVWNLGGKLCKNDRKIHLEKPIANTQVYILNRFMNPVPLGVTGELYIAGIGVGGGYVNRPELTKEKFLNNPFGEGFMFKTGDLAFWDEEGNVVYVGRNDFQVKINGQRVELEEIEATLSALDGVDSAAVVLRQEGLEQLLLCAFYTGKTMPTADLRALLSEILPSYMVPQIFVHMQALPLTTSGKIDRGALLDASKSREKTNHCYDPPQGSLETQICEAFGNVLMADPVGRTDNFYDLGGTSLQLIRLLSMPPLNKLSAAEFMLSPIPVALAKKLDNQNEEKYTHLVPLYVPEEYERAVVLIPYAGGDASAYTEFVSNARRCHRRVLLLYADWDYFENPAPLIDEIRDVARKKNTIIYSHCAGSALALKLLDDLNAEEQIIKGYMAAACVPPPKLPITFNGWAVKSDATVIRELKKAGFSAEGVGNAQIHEMMIRFRKQTALYDTYFLQKTKKTNVKTTVIVSSNDPFTKEYRAAEKRWKHTVTELQSVIIIHTKSHYFQKTESDWLLSLLLE